MSRPSLEQSGVQVMSRPSLEQSGVQVMSRPSLEQSGVLPHLCCDAIPQQDFNPMLFHISVQV